MKYTHCFFDLDGTLVNSAPGITSSVQYALQKCGIEPPPAEELLGFIGPSLMYGFSHFYNMNEEESRRAVNFYREIYTAGGMFKCEPYGGIRALLDALREKGIVCVLATGKPHIYANQILKHWKLDDYFSFVSGPELDGTRDPKHEVIAYAMEHLHLTDVSKILMIGDRDNDVLGAKHHGMDCAGVLWGFGTREELLGAGAIAVYDSPKALQNAILGE